MEKRISWKPDSRWACQEISCFHTIWNSITLFTRTRRWALSWPSWMHFTPSQLISLSILILFSNLPSSSTESSFYEGKEAGAWSWQLTSI